MTSVEVTVNQTADTIENLYPGRVYVYKTGECECGRSNRTWPFINTSTGMPLVSLGCSIYSMGDRNSNFLGDGSMPPDGTIQDMGHGCCVATITFNHKSNPSELATQMLKVAAEIATREAAFMATLETVIARG